MGCFSAEIVPKLAKTCAEKLQELNFKKEITMGAFYFRRKKILILTSINYIYLIIRIEMLLGLPRAVLQLTLNKLLWKRFSFARISM